MKNKIFLVVLSLVCVVSFSKAQSTTALFQGTIAQTSSNSVMIKIRPNETFSSQITNLQFVLQVPNTVTPQPTVTIKSNPLGSATPALNFVPTANYVLGQVTNEGGFFNYLFAVTTTGAPFYSFTNNTEVNALELQLAGVGTTSVRFAQLPNGGVLGDAGQYNFYVETGSGNTNEAAMFYGAGATNNPGGFGAYSFVPFPGIVLPVKFTSFSATKKDNDALLSWVVENETALVNNYEVERSIDGLKFDKINTISRNGGASSIYNIIDLNLSAIKNSGIIYYRIKQTDVNGAFVYSDIRNVRMNEKGTLISVFPNPVNEFTTVKIDATEAADATLALINADGKQIQVTTLKAVKGLNLKKVEMNNLPKGDYLLKVTLGTDVQTIKVVKL